MLRLVLCTFAFFLNVPCIYEIDSLIVNVPRIYEIDSLIAWDTCLFLTCVVSLSAFYVSFIEHVVSFHLQVMSKGLCRRWWAIRESSRARARWKSIAPLRLTLFGRVLGTV